MQIQLLNVLHITSPGRWEKLQIYHGDGFWNKVSNYRHSMTTNDSVFYSLVFSVASHVKEKEWKVTLTPCLNLCLSIIRNCNILQPLVLIRMQFNFWPLIKLFLDMH